ncbi:hypothetical protein [Priestia megaterium]|uniref:hypothetical protein n=1 Tax=Priestia megaterium TaxID=1404 RepID=UPI0022B896E2|nr:hypothetical protein [Priestia megaterium]MCZ8493613.1 hypothetical protein [Priestia megaterium]WDC90840.1 hypothetical protein PSR56_12610 [Priestia megaterium]
MAKKSKKQRKSLKDSKLTRILRFAGNQIPGKNMATGSYYWKMLNGVSKKAAQNGIEPELQLERELKKRIANLPNLHTPKPLLDLGVDLSAAFVSSRYFRKPWLLEGYWEVYKKCSPKAKSTLDFLTGL